MFYITLCDFNRGGSEMFGDKVKLKMTPEEIKIIVYALNELRN